MLVSALRSIGGLGIVGFGYSLPIQIAYLEPMSSLCEVCSLYTLPMLKGLSFLTEALSFFILLYNFFIL